MNVAAYGISWMSKSLLEQFITTDWKLIDYTAHKESYEAVLKEKPIAILSFAPPEELRSSETVKWLLSPGAGIDGMPLKKINQAGQQIINCHANAVAVAEHAWSLLLSTAKQIPKFDSQIKNQQKWPDTNQIRDTNSDLFDKTIGIIGFGAIGKILDGYADSFGMETLIFRKNPDEDQYHIDELAELAEELDYLIIACPLTDETKDMINLEIFKKLPSHSILVNIARGEIVVEEDLIEALREGHIKAAGIDVWRNSPYRGGEIGIPPKELAQVPNLIISPHRAWVSKQSFGMVAKQLAKELDLIAKGKQSENLVDISKGY